MAKNRVLQLACRSAARGLYLTVLLVGKECYLRSRYQVGDAGPSGRYGCVGHLDPPSHAWCLGLLLCGIEAFTRSASGALSAPL